MQGPSSSVTTLPENTNFDHGSASNDSGIESQMPWSTIPTPVQNRLPEYRMPSNETNSQYLQHVRREGPNVEWNIGEASSSSSQHLGDPNERKMEHAWSFGPRATNLALEERRLEQSNILSLDNVDVISNVNQNTHGLHASSSNALPQDLNMISGFVDSEDDDCQVVERPSSYISIGPSNEQMQSIGNPSGSFGGLPSTRSGYAMDEREDGRRISCKRKALEVNAGPSSGAGSSSFLQNDGRSQWRSMPSAHVAVGNTTMPIPTENDVVVNNASEPNPRLRLGVGAAASATPFSLTSSGNPESSRRNLRLRINGLYQQDPLPSNPFLPEADVGNVGNRDVSSSRYSSRLLRNQLFDMTPPPTVDNASLHVPPVRRHHQSRWSGASSRSSRSSAVASEDRSPLGESSSRHIPRSISEHPMFVPASEMGNSSQNPTNWNFHSGSSSNAASSSRAGPSTGLNPAAPSWSHRSYPQYPRRLSEIVRRSMLLNAGAEAGGQNSNNHGVRLGSSTLPPEMVLPPGPDSHANRVLNSRSAYLDRHLDGAFGVPYSLRTLAAAGEGRGSIMSEQIRQVLDLMRRGEGLRFEDVMILDHSVLFGMADMHDRHRDMRLDVDNMSYEELLALEERIGNVSTGLSEDAIVSRLKRHEYVCSKADDPETEPCSICREEYKNGEDLGALECGHNFHTECIKQWLTHKNLCPICKTTGLNT